MKTKNKKIVIAVSSVILAIILISLFIEFAWPQLMAKLLDDRSKWQFSYDFDEYSDDFVVIKDLILSYCKNEQPDPDNLIFHIERSEGEAAGIFLHSGSDSQKTYLVLTEKESASLARLCKYAASNNTDLSRIRATGEQIGFEPDSKPYSLVYSPSGKPKYWNLDKNENIEVETKRADSDWYHVVPKT